MRKIFLLAFLQLFFFELFAQSSININIIRPANTTGATTTFKVQVNSNEIGSIDNGSTISNNVILTSADLSVLLTVSSSIYNKEINFVAVTGRDYYFETGFSGSDLYLIATDNNGYQKALAKLKENESNSGLKNTQKNITYTTTTEDSKTQYKYNKDDKSLKVDYEKELDSEKLRQQWLEKGGKLKGTSFVGGASILYKSLPNDLLFSGIGANAAFGQNFLNLKIPEYSNGQSSWSSFQFGYGLSGSYNYTVVNSKTGENLIEPISSSYATLNINANLGFVGGKGYFIDQANWKGLSFELNYKPSMVIGIPKDGDTTTDFNFTGFSFDVNASNFTSTMNKIAPKAQLKFSIFVLPPVGDMPFFISISLGSLWYNK